MKKIVEIIISIIFVFSLVGCGPILTQEKMSDLDDGYVCEYRYGKNAKYINKILPEVIYA